MSYKLLINFFIIIMVFILGNSYAYSILTPPLSDFKIECSNFNELYLKNELLSNFNQTQTIENYDLQEIMINSFSNISVMSTLALTFIISTLYDYDLSVNNQTNYNFTIYFSELCNSKKLSDLNMNFYTENTSGFWISSQIFIQEENFYLNSNNLEYLLYSPHITEVIGNKNTFCSSGIIREYNYKLIKKTENWELFRGELVESCAYYFIIYLPLFLIIFGLSLFIVFLYKNKVNFSNFK
ncbi:MAG: hypothetical protein LAT82_01965 [Nanoarchaeota archaeon]|nr:hypothetical protein [Nanoarchaeota archaeon]